MEIFRRVSVQALYLAEDESELGFKTPSKQGGGEQDLQTGCKAVS